MTTEPMVPILANQRIADQVRLYADALAQLPEAQGDQVLVLARVDSTGATVTGLVQVRNVSGFVVGEWSATGDRAVTGGLRFRFGKR